jgi:CubicO group peptidase (beta-lactamase class C family)
MFMMTNSRGRGLDRRRFIGAAAAVVLLPPVAFSQVPRWQEVRSAASRLDQLHALVISLNGAVVVAESFRGPDVDRPVNVKSVSKTIVAAVTGAAIDRGVLPGVEATLGEVAPELIPRGADPRVAEITIADLVTMQAGLERTSGPNYGAWVSSPNWVADALGRPFVSPPGQRMAYSTGSFHVLGAVLAETSGRSLLELTRNWIGAPLDIQIPAWTRDPQGYFLGGNEMALSPLAMVRFGEMYRQEGVSEGTRVLSSDWVRSSFRPRTRSPFSGLDYGYGWFLGRARRHDFALARGYGGQIICVVPDLRLTLAITSDPTRPARSEGYFGDLLRLIDQSVIPAAELA